MVLSKYFNHLAQADDPILFFSVYRIQSYIIHMFCLQISVLSVNKGVHIIHQWVLYLNSTIFYINKLDRFYPEV
jgi:hypothetical protein